MADAISSRIERERNEMASKLLASEFSAEFINRLDETLLFKPLDTAAIRAITDIQLDKLSKLLIDNHSIELTVSEAAGTHLAIAGYDRAFGARPLKRLIQGQVRA